MTPLDQRHNSNLNRLVSNAKAIVANQIAIPLGVRKMNKIITWLSQIHYSSSIDMTVFQKFEDDINGCPVGTERLLWEKEALKLQDRTIDKALAVYKETLIDKCFEIIKFYDKD